MSTLDTIVEFWDKAPVMATLTACLIVGLFGAITYLFRSADS